MRSARRRAREFALQGLYQWLLAKHEPDAIAREIAQVKGFDKCDTGYFRTLITGAAQEAHALEAAFAPCLDRRVDELSPIERGILMIAGYEFMHHPEVPYRVVINEAIELAKAYGGTDGHKYVNGVLDKLAPVLRRDEVRRVSAAG